MNVRIQRFAALIALSFAATASLSATDASDPASGKKVNINQATSAQLTNLPRVGTKVADRIVEYRKTHGQFNQAEELMEVKGVGEHLFKELKPYIALSGPTTLTTKVSSRGTRGGPSGKKTASAAATTASTSASASKGK
ncbi:MAG TPA: helix-hairpin-helix domain-containing protein [Thermoanaerobaculia bacterium]|nr:helix-hairpin-helix domain-containing protein [Thermoanaerobaculia bacterium]